MRCLPYVVLALFTGACQPVVDSRQEIDLLVVKGLIIDVLADTPPEQIDIAILDGKILATGPVLAETYRATAQYDAAGRYLIPGLADMHSHFGNAIYSDDRDDSRPVLARHLYFGNTTILNMGSAQGWTARMNSWPVLLITAQMRAATMASGWVSMPTAPMAIGRKCWTGKGTAPTGLIW